MHRRFSAVTALLIAAVSSHSSLANDESRFSRIVEKPAELITLEIATIDMVPSEGSSGPQIGLVGVTHIGDAAFYADVQDLLEAYDIVLFEAVQPIATRIDSQDHDALVSHTRDAMQFVASAIESYKIANERYPADLAELSTFVQSEAPIVSNWLKRALNDAWEMPLSYELAEDGQSYTLRSAGGEDVLEFAAQATTQPLDLEHENIQQQLADALGLQFQLRSLTYGAPNWRPSDMTVNELNLALAQHGVDFAAVGGTLAGTSFPAKVVGILLKLMSVLDAMAQGAMSDMMKVMMIEMLGNEAVMEMSMDQLGEGFARVIIDERNQVVVDDVAAIVRDEPEIESVAVLYGAAHLPDLAERLETQLGYERDETTWLAAISVDVAASQMDAMQVRSMRMMIRRTLRQQLAR